MWAKPKDLGKRYFLMEKPLSQGRGEFTMKVESRVQRGKLPNRYTNGFIDGDAGKASCFGNSGVLVALSPGPVTKYPDPHRRDA